MTAAGSYLNPAYRIELESAEKDAWGHSIKISAFMPESFAVNLTSTWDSIVKNYIPMGNAAIDGLSTLAGTRTILDNISTLASWTGNSPLEFDVPFRFDAITDAYTDVFEPCITLMKMASPDLVNSLILTPPSGGLDYRVATAIYNNQKNNTEKPVYTAMKLKLGAFAYITGVVITGVNISFISKFDKRGMPMAADAQVSLRTLFSPTKKDIIEWFTKRTKDYDPLNGRLAAGKQLLDDIQQNGVKTVFKSTFGVD